MSADLLIWTRDPARAMQKRLAEFTRRADEEAKRTARTAEQMRWYGRKDDPPKGAA